MIKVMVAARRRPDMSREEFHLHALTTHANLVKVCPGFWKRCLHYTQNHIIGQFDPRTQAMTEGGATDYDVISEFWFDSEESALAAWTNEDFLRIVRPDGAKIVDPDAPYLIFHALEHPIGGHGPKGRTA